MCSRLRGTLLPKLGSSRSADSPRPPRDSRHGRARCFPANRAAHALTRAARGCRTPCVRARSPWLRRATARGWGRVGRTGAVEHARVAEVELVEGEHAVSIIGHLRAENDATESA